MVVMALKATLLKTSAVVSSWSSSNKNSIDEQSSGRVVHTSTLAQDKAGRRGILLSTLLLASQPSDSQIRLLQKYKKKSDENKEKNDKERLDSYYKRNYKDYFDFVEGSLKDKKDQELTESEKGILKWLEKNK